MKISKKSFIRFILIISFLLDLCYMSQKNDDSLSSRCITICFFYYHNFANDYMYHLYISWSYNFCSSHLKKFHTLNKN